MLRRALLASLFCLLFTTPAFAQEGFDWLESHIYFGLTTKDGEVVSQHDWGDFLDEAVTTRFPDGLTVIEAYGRSSTPLEGPQQGVTTKLLIIVHPKSQENATKLEDIKSAFVERFGPARIFHTESPVRVVE